MNSLRSFPLLLLVLASAATFACGAPESPVTSDELPADPDVSGDIFVPADSGESNAVLTLLNDGATDLELLDVTIGLDRRAAENLIAHRDGADGLPATADDDAFDGIPEVDAIPYVGPVTMEHLTQYADVQGLMAYSGGTWEGVAFASADVSLALDLVGKATKEELDVDAGLDVRAAENIVAARPITSMSKLAAISYVGPSAMEKLHAYLPTWQAKTTVVEVYDGVPFTAVEAARALAAANDANLDAFSSVQIFGTQANILIANRPYVTLSMVSSRPGIGSLTMQRLRTLGQAYPGVNPYIVTAGDAPLFATEAKNWLLVEAGWFPIIRALLTDVTGNTTFVDATIDAALATMRTRIDAFSVSQVGRVYSTRDAARFAYTQYGKGLQFAARSDYPNGLLDFVPAKSEAQRLARGKEGMLAYWQNTFLPSPQFVATFGAKTWNDVKGPVAADIANFENGPGYQVVTQPAETLFVGSTWQLYTEVNVDPVGKVTRVFIEID